MDEPALEGGSASLMPHIEATLIAKLNLADFQNAVPMLRELCIVNDAPDDAKELDLTIEAVPAFLKSKTWRIEAVGTGQRCRIADLDVSLEGALFSRLTEAEVATVSFKLRRRGESADEVARLDLTVELLPRNQWGGLSHLPDLVAAFVQPNEPAVERLLKQAAEVLRKNGRPSALDGYGSGSRHAWEIASSIWSAVAMTGVAYALPPASFEHAGQKVRGPEQILASGLATCLDLALMFCAALEQAGLNPILVFTKGHAFAGVWLKAEEFSSTVVDDVTALRKRVKLKELVLFETTVVTQHPAISFAHAIDLGSKQISEDKDESFELVVDIRRARMQRIKPLASSEASAIAPPAEPVQVVEPSFDDAPDLPDEAAVAEPDPATLNPKDRLARWQRKLLDLSLRNNLLNFRGGKKALKLEAPDPSSLEDLLSDGQAIRLVAKPDLMEGADPRSQSIFETRERADVRRQHALDALKRREVFVNVPVEELEPRLVDLFRTARTTLQEGGANTLFLAMGFLSWTRDDKAGQRYRAPLILVPVTLARKSVRSGFSVTLHDDEPRFNPTLIEMLRQDFKLNLGVADGELPKDEAGLDVAAIWKSVSYAVKDIKGWEVIEDVVLAMFSFAKYLMWKDLTERTDQLRENPVVRHLIDSPRDSYPSSVAFPNPRMLDHEFSPEQTFCPLPADSSQLSAVMAAAKGKDFVLIGPPGTGKSQTISNLIAQCLAEGKRVLFVSEKIAALDVVYRRLREVGLGEFCLELHSSKARKLDVLAQLQRSWEARGAVDSDVWRAEAQRLKRLRDQLNVYVERLHHRHSNGLTIYEAIGHVVDGEDVPTLHLSWGAANAHDVAQMDAMRDVVDRLEVNALAVGHGSLRTNPLAVIEHGDWSPSWQQGVIDAVRSVVSATQDLKRVSDSLTNSIGLPQTPLHRRARGAVGLLARALPHAAGRDWRFVLRPDASRMAERLKEGLGLLAQHSSLSGDLSARWTDSVAGDCMHGLKLLRQRSDTFGKLGSPWPEDVTSQLERGLGLLEQIEQLTKRLSVPYSDHIEQLNVAQLQSEWTKAEKAIWPLSWLGRRKIRRALAVAETGEGQADVESDLRSWVEIRALRSEVSKLEIGPETDGIWVGLRTKPDLARCALAFQKAFRNAKREHPWTDAGFESVTAGRCGDRQAKELALLRKVKALDAEILSLNNLSEPTSGLWSGLRTHVGLLGSALGFRVAVQAVQESGTLTGDHDDVARGQCGEAMAADFAKLRERSIVEHKLLSLDDLQEPTAGLWSGLRTRVDEVDKALKFLTYVAAVVANLSTTAEEIIAVKAPLSRILGEANALLSPGGLIASACERYLNAWSAHQPTVERLALMGGFSETGKAEFMDAPLDELDARCAAILRAETRLHAWCAWRTVYAQAKELGLERLLAAMEAGSVGQGATRRAFETSYSRWWLNAVVDQEHVIRTFVSAEHEKRIGDFRALDDKFTELTRAWVRAGLCAELPTQDNVPRNSEWGVLRHEMSKKRRHMPLRELMAHIPTALTKLTPCLLMSPLSIAQYLAADATSFGVVVFDEASQIPVWDAVGAIARGRQVVMVGDPKQLPPTNFFDRAESDADSEDIEGDLESILDECLGANLPTLNLAWHYRSRHESLIAFSNHRYYRGALITFPSPVTEDGAVSFHHVKGVYEKGGARINQVEAKALVNDLVARLKSPGFRKSGLTVGVVTFNTEQQKLIEDLLDEERRRDPSIEPYFDEVEFEPVFVKNLESVQGDERDIMYFSITYGPDMSGAVSMNFGPMNREGGERRLNVAITRARHELRVFSSLRAEKLDLARTQALGVRDLKHFLDFAERGPRALAESVGASLGDFESPFEESVASALAKKGWELRTQVGASAFRIDLAVVHPDASGIYLAGIECDGATYHRSATARDRDKLREQVLQGLGWKILRVWSTDWWIDAPGMLDKLDVALHSLLEISRIERAKAQEMEASRIAAEAIENAKISAGAVEPTENVDPVGRQHSHPVELQPSSTAGSDAPGHRSGSIAAYARSTSAPMAVSPIEFVIADPTAVVVGIDPSRFFEPAYDETLGKMIEHVVDIEGPILDAVLARRIARAHGWQRTGTRIQERVESLASRKFRITEEEVGSFYWASGRGPEMPMGFRKSEQEPARTVDEICMPELEALARHVVASGRTGEGAIIAMAREIGLQRLRAVTRGRFEDAIRRVSSKPSL